MANITIGLDEIKQELNMVDRKGLNGRILDVFDKQGKHIVLRELVKDAAMAVAGVCTPCRHFFEYLETIFKVDDIEGPIHDFYLEHLDEFYVTTMRLLTARIPKGFLYLAADTGTLRSVVYLRPAINVGVISQGMDEMGYSMTRLIDHLVKNH